MKQVSVAGLFVGVLFMVLSTGVVLAAHEASVSSFSVHTVGDDSFYNWDFEGLNHTRQSVDWPVTMVFKNGADVDFVKDMFYGSTFRAAHMNFRFNDGDQGNGWEWTSDRGTKGGTCYGTSYHMRLYANAQDSFYNIDWGYYVIGTTHIDYNECIPLWGWSGESQMAEHHFNAVATSQAISMSEDSYWMANYESFRQVGSHRVYNDGWATMYDVGPYT